MNEVGRVSPLSALTHQLVSGDYQATVSELGASLRGLTYRDRPLVISTERPDEGPPYSGAVLVPWPNRIDSGSYTYRGEGHQLPVNEVVRGTALHGLALWDRWTVQSRTAAELTLEHTLWPQPGYPFTVWVATTYELSEEGLSVRVTARNLGDSPAPFGASIHPYLVAGPDPVDQWVMHVQSAEVIEVDPERLLPRETVPVEGTKYDFRSPGRIGTVFIDNAYTGVTFDGMGLARATLRSGDGHGVQMEWDRDCQWVQVYTLENPATPAHRGAIAVEPMTCAPDAFNNGLGLIDLAPQQQHETRWRISAF